MANRLPGIVTLEQARPLFAAVTKRVFAPRPPNRLRDLAELVDAPGLAHAHWELYRYSLEDLAKLNGGLTVGSKAFSPRRFAGRGARIPAWPGGDVLSFLWAGSRPAAVIAESFSAEAHGWVRAHAAELGLACHVAAQSARQLHPAGTRLHRRVDAARVRRRPVAPRSNRI